MIKHITRTLILCLATLTACKPVARIHLNSQQVALAPDEPVLLLLPQDTLTTPDLVVAKVKTGDSGVSVFCSYEDVLKKLEQVARKYGSNLVKITKIKEPNAWTSCVRAEAILYRVPKVNAYESRIEWSAGRKLTWDDFKATYQAPPTLPNQYYTFFVYSGLDVTPHFRLFKRPTVSRSTYFVCHKSWVNPDYKNPNELARAQMFFDINELYSRILLKEAIESKLSIFNYPRKMGALREQIFNAYQNRLKAYHNETMDRNSNRQKKWQEVIEQELQALHPYAGKSSW